MLKKEFETMLFAVINKNDGIRLKSSSGGVFTPIAEHIIDAGGIVLSPAFSEGMRLIHIAVDNRENLTRLRGSKYVRSSMKEAFGIIKKNSGKPILFCGTPCQAGAIRNYFEGMEKLYVLDVVCHGVPMRRVFSKYIESIEKKYKSKVINMDFRKKTESWRRYSISIALQNGRQIDTAVEMDPYMQGFIGGMYLTTPCHACKFKGVRRTSDITIGDFWGIERFDASMDDDRGTSLVMINSEKGLELFDKVRDGFRVKPTHEEAAVRYNPGITESTAQHPKRKEFLAALGDRGFDDAAAQFIALPNPLRYRLSRLKHKLLGK